MRLIFTFLTIIAAPALWAAGTDSSLGQKDPGLLNLKGTIYALDENTEGMPEDLAKRKPIGVIYTDRLDVPPRDFTTGFPGVTDRFEWFGVMYTGTFEVSAAGSYGWRLLSDDGSRLWIDGQEIINNDGVHGFDGQDGQVELSKGPHSMRLWYFQGPATEIGLQLFVVPPGAEEKIFALTDFASGLTTALKSVDARATKEGIRVNLDAAVLFDTNKHELKTQAKESIAALINVISAYPRSTVEISGHTDSVGDTEPNQKLSERRAEAVRTALQGRIPADVKLTTTGSGESQPVAANDTEKGRALNRRVEILIRP